VFQEGSRALAVLLPSYLRGAWTHEFLRSLRDGSGSTMIRVGITIGLDALLVPFIVMSASAFGQDARERIKESTCPQPTRPLGSRIAPRRRTCSEAATRPTGHPTEDSSRGVFVPVITDRARPSRFRRSGASILPRVALLCGGGLSFLATLKKRWFRR
jgi:hypothetical protein